MSIERKIYKSTLVVLDEDTKTITLDEPMIPDMIQYQLFCGASATYDDTGDSNLPANVGIESGGALVYDLLGCNLFAIDAPNLFDTPAICNATNTSNPVFVMDNQRRKRFTGSYPVRIYNLLSMDTNITHGTFALKIDYYREQF